MAVLSSLLRAVRIRFLLASVIAVSSGLAVTYWKFGQIDPVHAALTYIGVIFLHASVDLLNDYWDHRRGIDNATIRTKYSGGTGVLPEKLLTPRAVYAAGLIFLIMGATIGAYFVAARGITIAIILGFAVVAIYFYSTSIVNAGLGELFVGIKGAMIVLGTFFVQTETIDPAAAYVGIIVGILSATVLFVNSFPDYAADRSKGRRTLVILLGRKRASNVFPAFLIAAYLMIAGGIFFEYTKVFSLLALVSIPFAASAVTSLRRNYEGVEALVPAMASTVWYSRITGAAVVVSLLI